MANFGGIIEWVLRLEDRTLAGKTVNLGDGAGLTRFGVTTKNCPGVAEAFWTLMPREQALEVAKSYYWTKYWVPVFGTQINSDDVAAEMLSFGVNDGDPTIIHMLQRILGRPQDGKMDLGLVALVNDQDGPTLAAKLRDAQEERYQAIIANNPGRYAKFENGWCKRAYAQYPDLPR
jgi:lysozyme family protein